MKGVITGLLVGIGVPLAVIGIALLIIAGPLLMIWSLNTLFALGIAYTWQTWVAALLIFGTLSAGRSK